MLTLEHVLYRYHNGDAISTLATRMSFVKDGAATLSTEISCDVLSDICLGSIGSRFSQAQFFRRRLCPIILVQYRVLTRLFNSYHLTFYLDNLLIDFPRVQICYFGQAVILEFCLAVSEI